jgi:hypothetical protein
MSRSITLAVSRNGAVIRSKCGFFSLPVRTGAALSPGDGLAAFVFPAFHSKSHLLRVNKNSSSLLFSFEEASYQQSAASRVLSAGMFLLIG